MSMNLTIMLARLAAVKSIMILQMVHWVTPLWKATVWLCSLLTSPCGHILQTLQTVME